MAIVVFTDVDDNDEDEEGAIAAKDVGSGLLGRIICLMRSTSSFAVATRFSTVPFALSTMDCARAVISRLRI